MTKQSYQIIIYLGRSRILTKITALAKYGGSTAPGSGSATLYKSEEIQQAFYTNQFVCNWCNSYFIHIEIISAWPQKNLDRNPLMKVFGRKRVFFECRDRGLVEVCYKWQFYEVNLYLPSIISTYQKILIIKYLSFKNYYQFLICLIIKHLRLNVL